jgi:hypothetical protein
MAKTGPFPDYNVSKKGQCRSSLIGCALNGNLPLQRLSAGEDPHVIIREGCNRKDAVRWAQVLLEAEFTPVFHDLQLDPEGTNQGLGSGVALEVDWELCLSKAPVN